MSMQAERERERAQTIDKFELIGYYYKLLKQSQSLQFNHPSGAGTRQAFDHLRIPDAFLQHNVNFMVDYYA